MRAALVFLLAACGTSEAVPIGPPPDVDAGCGAVGFDAGIDAAHSPSWTTSLHTPSLLTDMKRHASGDVILAGGLNAALDHDGIRIDAPQGMDPFVFRVDSSSGKLVWATTLASATSSPSTNHSVVNALAVDGDGVFVVGSAFGSSIAFGTNVVTFAPPASGSAPAHSFVAKLSATDGSVAWGITFDGGRASYDPNVQGECVTVVASGGEIDVGCEYQGAQFGLGTFSIKAAPPPAMALAMIHLVDGSSPTVSRAKSYQSDFSMLISDETRSPSGDVYFVSTFGTTITDLDDGTTVFANGTSNAVLAKLAPSGTLDAVSSPISVHLDSKLRYIDNALLLTGIDAVAKLDTSLNLESQTAGAFGGAFGVPISAPFGYYVARGPRFDPPLVVAMDACGNGARTYTAITYVGCEPPLVTIDGLELEDEGDMIMAGNYECSLTFDDGTSLATGLIDNSDWPWTDIYFARRPTF